MLAALVIAANTPKPPTKRRRMYNVGGPPVPLASFLDPEPVQVAYLEPQEGEKAVAWELGFDEFEKGAQVSMKTFALRAAKTADKVQEVAKPGPTPMQIVIQEIDARRAARKRLLRNGAIAAISAYALWRLLPFL